MSQQENIWWTIKCENNYLLQEILNESITKLSVLGKQTYKWTIKHTKTHTYTQSRQSLNRHKGALSFCPVESWSKTGAHSSYINVYEAFAPWNLRGDQEEWSCGETTILCPNAVPLNTANPVDPETIEAGRGTLNLLPMKAAQRKDF